MTIKLYEYYTVITSITHHHLLLFLYCYIYTWEQVILIILRIQKIQNMTMSNRHNYNVMINIQTFRQSDADDGRTALSHRFWIYSWKWPETVCAAYEALGAGVCVWVYIHIRDCIHIYIHIQIHIYIYRDTYICIYIHTQTYIHMWICIHTWKYICMYACMHVYTRMWM